MTVKEAAVSLGLTPSTIRNQLEKGVIRGRKIGRDWSITPREVERYRREHLGRRDRPTLHAPEFEPARLAGLRRPETKAKMRAAKLGRVLTPEHRAKVSAALRQRGSPSVETRERLAAPQRGRPKSPMHAAAIQAAMTRPDVRARRAAALRGRVVTPEQRLAISRTKTGTTLTPEHRRRVSRAIADAYRDGRRGMSRLEREAADILLPIGFVPFPWLDGHGFDFGSADGRTVVEVNACRIHDHRVDDPSCPFTPFGKARNDRYRTVVERHNLTLVELWECQRASWPALIAHR